MTKNISLLFHDEIYSFLFLFIFLFSYILYMIFHHKRTYRQACQENLDILKYVSSILIVLFHINIYMELIYKTDFIITDCLTRLTVPFFFTIAGYLIAQNENRGEHYIRNYLKELFKTYVIWSIIYLPLGIEYILNMNLPWYLFPVALVVAFLYIGIYYHLWYFPALFFSILILHVAKKKFSLNTLLVISFLLLALGSLESYFGYLNPFWQNFFQTYYFSIFYTTRNFLFFGLFYVILGYTIQVKQWIWKTRYDALLVLSALLFFFDCILAQITKGIDRNIMISAPFFVFFLFLRILYSPELCPSLNKRKIRRLSKYYFFVHPYVLEGLFLVHKHYHLVSIIFLSLLGTHILTLLCFRIKKQFPKLPL